MNWEAANKTITTLGCIAIAIWIGIGIYRAPILVISLLTVVWLIYSYWNKRLK
jgi:hypothetical protein